MGRIHSPSHFVDRLGSKISQTTSRAWSGGHHISVLDENPQDPGVSTKCETTTYNAVGRPPPWREGPDTSGFLMLLIASVDNDMKECVLSGLFWVTFKHRTLNLGTLSGSQATANLCQVRK